MLLLWLQTTNVSVTRITYSVTQLSLVPQLLSKLLTVSFLYVCLQQTLIEHFSDHLAPDFTTDAKKLASELRSLKRIVRHYYDRKPCGDVWQCILRYRRAELPSLCQLVEVTMATDISSRYVESCFGFLTSMLNDRRLSMYHDTMSDLLLIRANHPTWSVEERDEIITDALRSFACSHRKQQLRNHQSSLEPPSKLAAILSHHGNGEQLSSPSPMQSNVNSDYSDTSESDSDDGISGNADSSGFTDTDST